MIDVDKLMMKALKAGAKALADRTKMGLTGKLTKLQKGVKTRVDTTTNEVTVHIMGDYRLRWFEKGTKPRMTKRSKAKRGAIKATRFFSKARADEGAITAAIDRVFNEGL